MSWLFRAAICDRSVAIVLPMAAVRPSAALCFAWLSVSDFANALRVQTSVDLSDDRAENHVIRI